MVSEGSKHRCKVVVVVHVIVAALFLVAAGPSRTRAATANAGAGETLFHAYCSPCHTIGQGDKLGPDLKGVTGLRSRQWLERWIQAPDKVLAEKDPVALSLLKKYRLPMPDLKLTHAQVAELVKFLGAGEAGAAPGAAPAAPAAAAAAPEMAVGNATVGRELFTGAKRLQSGGAACMGCHSIAGIGALGGGTMGPDLTPSWGKLGVAAVSWPETMPPMRAIFTAHPLTNTEKADLIAFLKTASIPERGRWELGTLALLAVVGALVILLLMHLVWRGRLSRLGGVRRSVVKRG